MQKVAVMIRGPCPSHPISALWAVLDNIRATPWVWGAFSYFCPENSRSSPVISRLWPEPVYHLFPDWEPIVPHLCSHLCCLASLSFSVYLEASRWSAVSGIVCTFHVPMVVVVLGETNVVGLAACRWTWLSLPGVIGLQARGLSTPQAIASLGMPLDVSVAVQSFMR